VRTASFPASPPPRWSAPVVALGNFDGFHAGHARLIEEIRLRAAERSGTSVALTFEPHPPRVVRPDKAPRLLMTPAQRSAALESAGVDALATVAFTLELSRWEPEAFVQRVLVDWLNVAEVWVGENFLFGRDRTGTLTLLRALGQDIGFAVRQIEPVRVREFVVSSTRIRHLVSAGRVEEASELLGHPYEIAGIVVHGDHRGRELGVPTANLQTENELLPAAGVYVTVATIDGERAVAATSVGVRPTIGDGRVTVEAHVLDRDVNLYGKSLRLSFVRWLRPQVAFDSLDALRQQMARDLDLVRAMSDRIG
jgi:riboflavin kinase/FMN adenylyltransferase